MDTTKAGENTAAEPIGGGHDLEFKCIEMEAIVGVHIGTAEHDSLGFKLTSAMDEASDTGRTYAASIPDRSIVWMAPTPARAMAHMLHGIAMLARDGSLDPNEPSRKGVPPIQHVLGVLTDRLAWHVDARRRSCDETAMQPVGDPANPRTAENAAWQARCNEVISALGTAISALARIKDL